MRQSICLLFFAMFLLVSCGENKNSSKGTPTYNDSRYSTYIKSYTSGLISKKDNITISFTENVNIPNDLSAEEFLSISPSLEGTLVKSGANTVTFSPVKLASGKEYQIKLDLSKLASIPKNLKKFEFSINVIAQDFEIQTQAPQSPDPSQPDALTLEGAITTADVVENEAVEKMLSLENGLKISWQHPSATNHKFAITGITRGQAPRSLVIPVSGTPIDVKKSQDIRFEIPSVLVFGLASTQVSHGKNGYVSIFFTDPLAPGQDLEGLVHIEEVNNPRMIIQGNEIRVFVPSNINGSKKLELFAGIQNSRGQKLLENSSTYIAFEPEKPALKLIGKGSILPSTDGMVLPFEAVNLRSVDVEVVQIFEDNLPQFLQTNTLAGNEQTQRVGKLVLRKKVDLSASNANLGSWGRYTLDLSDLIAGEKGALYQIRIGFDPSDTNYPCDATFEPTDETDAENDWSISQPDGFNSWGSPFNNRYPAGYTWRQRENPCHVSYYHSGRFVTTNLLASDIGLISKIGADNSMLVFATDMITAQPIAANITVYDYQLQNLSEGVSDQNGSFSFTPSARPFLIIAEKNGQKSYLKLDDNSALSMSNFDVSGTKVKGGIKGFIYGERGVWRPGDDIFLSFILEDDKNELPIDYPVVVELRDPKGNVTTRQVLTNHVRRLYTTTLQTSKDDQTGNWRAVYKVGNSRFSKTLKIETVKPNRLKIEVDFGTDKLTASNSSMSTSLDAKWLTGLSAGGLKAESEVRLSAQKTTFTGFAQYEFDDRGKSFYQDPKQVFSGQLDASGKAKINLKLPSKPNSPGALAVNLSTKVFEPGGGFSINTKKTTYLPYKHFVGMNVPTASRGNRIERDAKQTISVISLSDEGTPVSREKLEFKLYKLSWRWWWDQSAYDNANYNSSSYATLVKSQRFNTVAGKAQLSFTIKSPNWGRYIAVIKDPVSGHSTSQILYTSWYGSDENTMGANLLEVNTDKTDYKTGEKIQLTLKGSKTGQALVSVENGSKVLQSFWVKTEKEWTTIQLDATPDMAPNVYVHVSLIQPHGQTSNDLPIRLYGIAPINVYDPDTKLEPVLEMADKLAPESPVNITVRETNGKPMSYTVAMVDEGLLDLTNFATPDPWSHFFKKEAIGVKTWDLYDHVIGAYGGRLERLLAVGGGDGGLSDEDKKEDNRFKPVVKFIGPFYLNAGESADHVIKMPQYIGSVRTMVVGQLDGAYGNTSKATPVIQPLMVLGTMPRVVGPGEKISMPVNVFRFEESLKNAQITVETSGVLKLANAAKKSIVLTGETTTSYFDLEVADQLGAGKIVIKASSGSEQATHEINITSRAPNAPQTLVELITLQPGQSKATSLKSFGIAGTNNVTLELASIPPINLSSRLQYLIRYPHGCIEQTVSSIFPQLFLKKITNVSVEQEVQIVSNIKSAIAKIQKFQTADGGLAYWPGNSSYNSWGTNYAFHFLVEAQKAGYQVNSDLMQKLLSFQSNQARKWSKSNDDRYRQDDLIQAYRLFALALSGNADLSAMNRLRNTTGNSIQTMQKLAAAYAVIGQQEAARSLLKDRARSSLKQSSSNYYYYSYGSFTRDLAMLAETYVYLDNQTEAFKIIQELSEKLSSDTWLSTQTTAYALLAIGKFISVNQTQDGSKSLLTHSGTSTSVEFKDAIHQISLPEKSLADLKIENKGTGTLFATLNVTGIPKAGDEPVFQSDLSCNVQYLSTNGRALKVDSLPLGSSFEIMLTITNSSNLGAIKDIALTQIIPSGWEIQNDRLADIASDGSSDFDFQDIQDDRVNTYFDLGSNQSKSFRMTVTAAYPGRYYLPGAQVEAMYKASVGAKKAGRWVYVVNQ
ncbi:MAG: hypothetical protein JXR10_11370 [Cyclobacteriaceae bacterium]